MDAEVEDKAVVGLEFGPLVAVVHFNRLFHAHKLLGRILFNHTRRADEINEGGARAVHHRNLRRVHIHVDVVDSEAV